MTNFEPIILASASPRRTELLNQIRIAHQVLPVDIDETPRIEESPAQTVQRLATEKAQAAQARLPAEQQQSRVILAADTLIEIDQHALGKPNNEAECVAMLSLMSGRLHHVLTAISVLKGARQETLLCTTEVEFAVLSEAQMRAYWHTGEPADKAGSYAIQGIGGQFVKSIKGSASAVIGLPLFETKQLLQAFEVQI